WPCKSRSATAVPLLPSKKSPASSPELIRLQFGAASSPKRCTETPGACAVRGGGGAGPRRSSSRGISFARTAFLGFLSQRRSFQKSKFTPRTLARASSIPEMDLQALRPGGVYGDPRPVNRPGHGRPAFEGPGGRDRSRLSRYER